MAETFYEVMGIFSTLLSLSIATTGTWLIYKGKIKPHVFTVLTWLIVAFIICLTMLLEEEYAAAWRSGMMTLILVVAAALCLRNNKSWGWPR